MADKAKSITNAEYIAAKENGIPVFTYIRDNVLSNHHIYQQNRNKKFAREISYPAIEKQEHASDIFNFIDDVRRSRANNAFEGFANFQDVEDHLRKQWAGMFYELLKSREVKNQIDATNHLITGIASSGQKLEALVKSLYMSSNREEAKAEIETIEVVSDIVKFYREALFPEFLRESDYYFDSSKFNVDKISSIAPDQNTWHEYLVLTNLFAYREGGKSQDKTMIECSVFSSDNGLARFAFPVNGELSQELKKIFDKRVKVSTQEQRKEALEKIFNFEV